ncbi:hypothetical protein ZWY2020_044901 [Hordeum vulgare]|nr:hypothetical protein ZWY2020_044901 [Hordeum vulgare]
MASARTSRWPASRWSCRRTWSRTRTASGGCRCWTGRRSAPRWPTSGRALHYRLVASSPPSSRGRRHRRAHLAPRLLRRRHASPRGSYVTTWPKGPAAVLEVEHCICHPDNAEVRVRLVQTVVLAKDVARLRGLKDAAQRGGAGGGGGSGPRWWR